MEELRVHEKYRLGNLLLVPKEVSVSAYILLMLAILLLCGACENKPEEKLADDQITKFADSLITPTITIQSINNQIRLSPEDFSLYEDRSRLYYAQNHIDSALLDIQTAIKLNRNEPDLHYLHGFYSLAKRDTFQAYESFQTAAGLGTKNAEVFYELGQLYFHSGEDLQALDYYAEAASLDSLAPTYLFAQGFLHESRERYTEAIRWYRNTLGVDSLYVKALVRLHEVYLHEYESEDFAQLYRDQLIRNHPGHPLAHYYQGDYHIRQILRTDSVLQTQSFQYHLNEAVSHYTISIRQDSAFAQAYYNRGYCYFLAAKYQEAIQDFEQAVNRKPDYAEAYFMLGSLFEGFDESSKALSYYSKAVEFKPDFEDAIRAVQELSP